MHRLVLLGVAAASLFAAGCPLLGGSCNCPSLGPASVGLPAGESSPVALITTGSTCSAIQQSDGSIEVNAKSTSPTSCGVVVQFMNGDLLSFTVDFQAFDPGGCCSGIRGVVRGEPQFSDGGVD
jgi:hypothetical protein